MINYNGFMAAVAFAVLSLSPVQNIIQNLPHVEVTTAQADAGVIDFVRDRILGRVDEVDPVPERELSEDDYRQIECLAQNVYHEARGEPKTGQIAVNQVVKNRAESGLFPPTICEVVWQNNRRGCQFSWTCDGRSDRIRDQETYAAIYQDAVAFYTHRPVDITAGAEYYHASYVRPRWSRVFDRTARIGNHIFYRA